MSEKKQFGEYYLGLDIGTDSIGWAVTDPMYDVLKFNGKAMWGIHLFKSGNTAEERRMHRCSRRRLQRRNQRLSLLRGLFTEEISKVDPNFFQRMKESDLIPEDRSLCQKNSLFDDPTFKDKNFHKKFPTIYHLRKYLMETDEKPDIRLVYLALHHIIKNRGHFLFEGISDEPVPDFNMIFSRMIESLSSQFDIIFSVNENIDEIKKLLMDRGKTVTDKKNELNNLMSVESEKQKAITTLLSGGKTKISSIIDDLDQDEIKAVDPISFKGSAFDDAHSDIEDAIGTENITVLDIVKSVYDWSVLSGMLNGMRTLSDAKVADYEQHKKDLALLKTVLKAYAQEHDNDMTLYNFVFKSPKKNSYSSYVGVYKNKNDLKESTTQEEFCKYISNNLKDFDFERNDALKEMKKRLDNYSFLPKQRDKNNSVIPNGLHRIEMKMILDNVSKHYDFLNEEDENGVSVRAKIDSLLSFRIPYYVGPLNSRSDYAWAVRKKDGRVYPWNFSEIIDIEKSSEKFIENLISDCTYLKGEDVLPKSSILYSRYMLYNEINNIRIDGERIDPELKKQMVEDIFLNSNLVRVGKKAISDYIRMKKGVSDVELSGFDETIKTSLQSERKMRAILGDIKGKTAFCDEMIRIITIYGDDRKRLFNKLTADYGEKLSKEQIGKLSVLKFSDWGRLSEKLLTGIYGRMDDGREMNIITALEQTNLNFMELMSDRFSFLKQIERINDDHLGQTDGKISQELVDDLYCSPAVKHSIWRVLSVIKDILKVTGHKPKKVFIETTREVRDDGRKISRKLDLIKKYREAIEKSDNFTELISSLETTDDARLRSKKLFAYYLQEGHCAYCGRPIDLNDLGNNDMCDMDHIYPQSKVTDDSIINNMVLSCKTCNADKTNRYPISEDVQKKMKPFWNHLKNIKLMSDEKYKRLTRRDGFSEDELRGFINRQLVETSQSVKAVAKVLEKVFGDESDIVYVKGVNVSKFRNDNKERMYYTKCRNVNDYHHAKDAYLNIVVGNVYDTKFTKNPANILKSGEKYNLNKMFEHDVVRNGECAWIAGDGGTIRTVDKNIKRNNILFTRYQYKGTGQLFDVQLVKKGEDLLPKRDDLPTEKYGGYNSLKGSHFVLVEHQKGKKRVRTIEPILKYNADELDSNDAMVDYFISKGLVDPKICIKCIKLDSMFKIGNARMSLSGRTGDSLIFCGAEQLILPYELHNYCKLIYKYCDDLKQKGTNIAAKDYGLNSESNVRLYGSLMDKMRGRYLDIASISSLYNTLDEAREKFIGLNLDEQIKCLDNILRLFQCNASLSSLEYIDGPKVVGRVRITKNISVWSSAYMIAQSSSGLFEKEIDLKTHDMENR